MAGIDDKLGHQHFVVVYKDFRELLYVPPKHPASRGRHTAGRPQVFRLFGRADFRLRDIFGWHGLQAKVL